MTCKSGGVSKTVFTKVNIDEIVAARETVVNIGQRVGVVWNDACDYGSDMTPVHNAETHFTKMDYVVP